MFKKLRNKKGFTLVEVIVVAVIVAVLALVAIQLYRGYVTESRQNTAENLAASAASFLQAALNSNGDLTGCGDNPLTDAGSWVVSLPGGNTVVFNCPKDATVTYTPASATVVAQVKTVSSTGVYKYDVGS